MKILHSADWHLDSPIQGRTEAQTARLKEALLGIPHMVAAAAKAEHCDLVFLSGDLFDGTPSRDSVFALKEALQELSVPVFISPGNHDYYSPTSVWATEIWPEHVHIFRSNAIEQIPIPSLDCRVYGAAFTGTDAPALLSGFHADQDETYQLGVFHGDPTQAISPYDPITAQDVRASGLHYLALGHIHKRGQLDAGQTLCAWPGCPMGRGFDELEAKGVLIVDLDSQDPLRFLPLAVPRFFDWELTVTGDPAAAIASLLPAVGNLDFYRMTLTGEHEALNLEDLQSQFPQFPNLILRDKTVPPLDIWGCSQEDSLEGVYFRMLREAMEGQDEQTVTQIQLAAKISRQLLNGQEVVLP